MVTVCALLLFAFVQAAAAGDAPAAAAPSTQPAPAAKTGDLSTPADAKERMEMARKMNGLRGLDGQPWHLKASYEVFDAGGKSKDKGTFEEWWVNTKHYKLAYSSPEVSVAEYGTDHGVFLSGGQDRPSQPLALLQRKIEEPIPSQASPGDQRFKNFERSFGSVKLSCTALNQNGSEPNHESDSFCFGPTNAVLLYESSSAEAFQTLFQNVMRFHGHYVARDLRIFLLGVPWLSVHIEAMEDLAPTELSVVAVPAGARAVPLRVAGPGIVSPGALIKKVTPRYPAEAKMQRVQGRVILAATIGTDGHILKLEVLGGPQALQQPTLDAVRQWVYKPFLRDGEPVEVDMSINVVFNLAG